MDTKKLRQKVLDLAIHGKLVKQDPNDEPASILLDRIRAEKARLVKEGKIKKSELIEKPISEDEIPFEVPEGWEWCRLAAIINMLSGQDFPPSKYNDKGLGIPYITGASNIQDAKILVNRWTETPTVIAKQNDLLIVCKGSGVGKMAICNIEQGHIARQIQALRNTYKLANLQYIRYVIEVNLRPIISNANGIIPGLPRDILLDLILPLPPLAEQHRIVKAVDELFEQIDIIERSEKELEEAANKTRDKLLNLAIQGHLVPQDPNEETASVLLERIRAEKARLVKEGKLKKKDLEEKPISPGFLDPSSLKKWPKEYKLKTGDVLVNSTGTGTVGRTRLFNESCLGNYPFVVPDSHVSVVRSFDCIHSEYLYYLMNTKWIQTYFEDNLAGSTNQKELYIDVLGKTPVPLPPLPEQRRIVEKIEEILSEIEKLHS